MRTSALMSRDVVTADVEDGIETAMRAMDRYGVRHLPVLRAETVVGVVSDRDLLRASGWTKDGRVANASAGQKLGEIMSSPVVHAHVDEDVVSIAVAMVGRGIGFLPVLDDGRIVGVVSEFDVIDAAARARRERRRRTGQRADTVGHHMSTPPCTIRASATLEDAIELCRADGLRHVPVLDAEGVLVGIVTDRDLRRALGQDRSFGTTVDELMTTDPITIDSEAPLTAAADLMILHWISCLPVTSGDSLVGVLTVTDLLEDALDGLGGGGSAQSG